MIYRNIFVLLFLVLGFSISNAQNHYKRFESIDVLRYQFELKLFDGTDRIDGKAIISIKFLKPVEDITLDLAEVNSDNLGMLVHSVKKDGLGLAFIQAHNKLGIHLNEPAKPDQIIEFNIDYSGTPADGLIISENKYGDRTFFGDNWPDRAHNWLPTVDHPSDKALVSFSVTAPKHYQVVANGKRDTIIDLQNGYLTTVWNEDVPISTKLMVIGAADFVVGNDTVWNGIPVNAWVFKENAKSGLYNYRFGTEALAYYSELIGPFSYEKLAHVQSKTRYGGMENASCIFYSENSAIVDRSQENLFAHEVAHQWFGNSATEQNWHHVWLSEGFATYLTHVYNQHYHGEQEFRQGLRSDRERVINFAKRYQGPIIDTLVTDYTQLLNANSYQKGSWFLHMLRNKLGDENFFKGLRSYYSRFQNSTALTSDFRKAMEDVSGEDLKGFFDQWLRQAGHPMLKWNWKQNPDTELSVDIKQVQKDAFFTFPLEIAALYEDGSHESFLISIDQKTSSFVLPVTQKVKSIELDPEVNLLFEEAK